MKSLLNEQKTWLIRNLGCKADVRAKPLGDFSGQYGPRMLILKVKEKKNLVKAIQQAQAYLAMNGEDDGRRAPGAPAPKINPNSRTQADLADKRQGCAPIL